MTRTVDIGSTKGFQKILDARKLSLGFFLRGSTCFIELSREQRRKLVAAIREARVRGHVNLHETAHVTVWLSEVVRGTDAPFLFRLKA